MRQALLDPQFFVKIKIELQKMNTEVHTASLGGQCTKDYINNLQPDNCNSEIRKQVHHDIQMKQFIAQNPIRLRQSEDSGQKKEMMIVNKPEYIVNLDLLMRQISKKQKE